MWPLRSQLCTLVGLYCVFQSVEAGSGQRRGLRCPILDHDCARRGNGLRRPFGDDTRDLIRDRVHDRMEQRCQNQLTRGLKGQLYSGKRRLRKLVLCYWDSKTNIENIPVNLCSHVIYSGVELDTPINAKRNASLAVLRKKNPDLSISLGLGSWLENSERYLKMLRSRSRRQNFVSKVFSWVRSGELDGVSLNSFCPETRDGLHFVKLVKEIRESFEEHRKNVIITVILPAVMPQLLDDYAILDLLPIVNYFAIMRYDEKDVRPSSANFHHEELTFAVAEAFVERGVRERNILLGIPFFGRSYTVNATLNQYGRNSWGSSGHAMNHAGSFRKGHRFLAYFEICRNLRTDWTRMWDQQALRPLAYSKNQWVSYEDEQSIRCKVKHIRLHHYGGVAVWTADMDDSAGSCGRKSPLLKTIQEELNGMVFTASPLTTITQCTSTVIRQAVKTTPPVKPITATANTKTPPVVTTMRLAATSIADKYEVTAPAKTSVGKTIGGTETISPTVLEDATLHQEPGVTTLDQTVQSAGKGTTTVLSTSVPLTPAEAGTLPLSTPTVSPTPSPKARNGEEAARGEPGDSGIPVPHSRVCESTTETLVAHEKDCAAFYHCSNGLAYLHQCPNRSIFDTSQLVCNWPEDVHRPECKVVTSS